MTEWAIRFAVSTAMWCGWTAMVAGGGAMAALSILVAVNCWRRVYRALVRETEKAREA